MQVNRNQACRVACTQANQSFSFNYTKPQVVQLAKFIRQGFRAQLYVLCCDFVLCCIVLYCWG